MRCFRCLHRIKPVTIRRSTPPLFVQRKFICLWLSFISFLFVIVIRYTHTYTSTNCLQNAIKKPTKFKYIFKIIKMQICLQTSHILRSHKKRKKKTSHTQYRTPHTPYSSHFTHLYTLHWYSSSCRVLCTLHIHNFWMIFVWITLDPTKVCLTPSRNHWLGFTVFLFYL